MIGPEGAPAVAKEAYEALLAPPRALSPSDRRRDVRLRKKYGITLEDYNRIFVAQGGHCAICPRRPVRVPLNVDHDHKTGSGPGCRVRGLLCWKCNYGLKWFEDNPARLMAAAHYLDKED